MPSQTLTRSQNDPDLTCWIHIQQERPDGFVEFDFAIGDPELSVDLILAKADFERFCTQHQTRTISPEQAQRLDAEQAKWRYGQAGLVD